MWQSVRNHLYSLLTYRDLSPDRAVRRQVNARLRNRPNLSFTAWAALFPTTGQHPPTSLLAFVYTRLPEYSGLEVGRVRPSDRLIDDLKLPLVCWFDWPYKLCDDFYETFQVDISEEFDEALLSTVGDLVDFLDGHLQFLDALP